MFKSVFSCDCFGWDSFVYFLGTILTVTVLTVKILLFGTVLSGTAFSVHQTNFKLSQKSH